MSVVHKTENTNPGLYFMMFIMFLRLESDSRDPFYQHGLTGRMNK